MINYSWNELIYDPTSEKAKDCLNKEVYFSPSNVLCFQSALLDDKNNLGILTKIGSKDEGAPFEITKGETKHYCACIIKRKKGPLTTSNYKEEKDKMSEGMPKEVDCGNEKITFEEEFESLPIDMELKMGLLEKLRRLEEENSDLKRQLRDCRLKIQNNKEVIYKLVTSLLDSKEIYIND